MNLTYRGISYKTSTTSIQSNNTTQMSKYRGQTYSIKASMINSGKASYDLVYRGIKSSKTTTKPSIQLKPAFN